MLVNYRNRGAILLCAALLGLAAPAVSAQTPREAYARALARERAVRNDPASTLPQIRAAIDAFEALARRRPPSGYSDNALWQAANLAALAYERFGQPRDKRTALRLIEQLKQQFPSSSLIARADEVPRQFETRPAPPAPNAPAAGAPPLPAAPAAAPTAPVATAAAHVTLRDITRTSLPDGMRVTLEFDGESAYRSERLDNPRRVFFDLKNVRPVPALQDATLKFPDQAIREIRLGRHPGATRVVMDMDGVETYSVFTLYDPFRLVIDFQRAAVAPAPPVAAVPLNPRPPATAPAVTVAPVPPPQPERPAATQAQRVPAPPLAPLTPPALPSVNSNGQFSIARQLGLGISRIVIDAGHGGHDPGAKANGLTEAEVVLDVAIRLAKLFEKQPGFEVVMTRDQDVFIPLEERTAIANREGADLFLSIHANASRNSQARGVETYFLNFASNPHAEAVAARENAGSARTMHNLPEIVRAIALNNKIDESRDLAGFVQKSMVRRMSSRNRQLKDLGVKQAPFVVLIGAGMPSVLAEISFVTHRQEAQLLKSGAYRQQIAEALFEAVLKYQQSLKKPRAVAAR